VFKSDLHGVARRHLPVVLYTTGVIDIILKVGPWQERHMWALGKRGTCLSALHAFVRWFPGITKGPMWVT